MSGLPTLTRGAVNGYYMSLTLMVIVAFSVWLVMRTRIGTALSAIGMNEEAVKGSGLSVTRLKLFAFLLSAMIAGLGGAMYVHYLGSIAPRALFDINFVFTIIVAALIGGASTTIGPIIGAFFSDLSAGISAALPARCRALFYLWWGGIAIVYVPTQRNL